ISSDAGTMQVARGSAIRDDAGVRQATALFPPGTTAIMVLPDGGSQPLTSFRVRATEFTVGNLGPNAMPAELPPASAYTYALQLSVDEAGAQGSNEVRFNQPVSFYVENFIGFPAGTSVPAGSYDRSAAVWKPESDGRVIAVLGSTGGLATLDVDGDGAAD